MMLVCGQDASGGGRASGARLPPVPPYLHVGPDLSLAARTVWDETLASQGRGAGSSFVIIIKHFLFINTCAIRRFS